MPEYAMWIRIVHCSLVLMYECLNNPWTSISYMGSTCVDKCLQRLQRAVVKLTTFPPNLLPKLVKLLHFMVKIIMGFCGVGWDSALFKFWLGIEKSGVGGGQNWSWNGSEKLQIPSISSSIKNNKKQNPSCVGPNTSSIARGVKRRGKGQVYFLFH